MPSSLLISSGKDGLQSWKMSANGLRESSSLRVTSEVTCAAFGAQGSVLATGGDEGSLQVRDGSRGSVIASLETRGSRPKTLAFSSSSSRTLCSGHEDGRLKVWDVHSRKVVQEYKSEAPISCSGFRRGDDYVAFGTDNRVRVVSLVSKSRVASLEMNQQNITNLAWSPHRKGVLAAADEGGALSVWDIIRSDTPVLRADVHSAPVTGVRFSPTNNLLFCTASLDKKLRFFDLRARKSMKTIHSEGPISALDFHPGGFRVACAVTAGSLLIFDLRGSCDIPTHCVRSHSPGINVLKFRPIGSVHQSRMSIESECPPTPEIHSPSVIMPTPAKRTDIKDQTKEFNRLDFLFSPPRQPTLTRAATHCLDEESVIIPSAQKSIAGQADKSLSFLDGYDRAPKTLLNSEHDDKENIGIGPNLHYDRLTTNDKTRTEATMKDRRSRASPSARKSPGCREHLQFGATLDRPPTMSTSVPQKKGKVNDVTSPQTASRKGPSFPPLATHAKPEQEVTSLSSLRSDSQVPGKSCGASVPGPGTSAMPVQGCDGGSDRGPQRARGSCDDSPLLDPGRAVQDELLKRSVEDAMGSVVGDLRSAVRNLHIEVLRGFHETQKDVQRMLSEQNEACAQLSHELDSLRAENRRLRTCVNSVGMASVDIEER